MTILDIKVNIETFFQSNYSETPIHWAGTQFDTTSVNEWVYIEYNGDTVNESGISADIYQHKGRISFSIVAKTAFRVSELASLIIDMFKLADIDGVFSRGTSIIDQGYDSELDKSYMVLDIKVSNH